MKAISADPKRPTVVERSCMYVTFDLLNGDVCCDLPVSSPVALV